MESKTEKELKDIVNEYKKLKARHSWPSAAKLSVQLDRLAVLVEGKVPPGPAKGRKNYNEK